MEMRGSVSIGNIMIEARIYTTKRHYAFVLCEKKLLAYKIKEVRNKYDSENTCIG
jgi:hypothetical protein